MRPVGIVGVGFAAMAMAPASAPAISVTTAGQLEVAVASATSSTRISIDADITASTPGTMLTLPAGCTLGESGPYNLTGYYVQSQAAGNYSVTSIGTQPKRLTIISPTSNPNAYLGTVHLENGKFILNANVKGPNGGGNKTGNLVSAFSSNFNRVECDVFGDYENASADCVAIDGGTNPQVAGSYIRAWGAKFRSPGSAASDNWFTGHMGLACQAFYCDFALPGTAGPGINSAPVKSTMEVYGGQINMAGSAGTVSSDLFLTRLIGVKIIGASANSVRLVADDNKPTKPAMALRVQSSISIIAAGTHSVSPIWAEVELTTADTYVGVIGTGSDYSGPPLWMAKIKGSCNSGSKSVIWLKGDATIYNPTTLHTSVTNSVAVRYGYAGPATANIYRASINSGGALNLAFATRNDMANTTLNIINSRAKAAAGGFTNGTAGAAFNLTGTALNDTEPSGGLTGWLNESPELAADPTWVKIKAYLATCPALPGDTSPNYPTNVDAYI